MEEKENSKTEEEETKTAVKETAAKPVEEEKPKVEKEERTGIVYIYGTPNNTFVHITDLAGSTISRITGGMITKHSRLKSSPTIAMFVAKKAAERAKDLGITSLYVRTKAKTGGIGIGPGTHAAVKALGKDFKLISILDISKVARGGPKKKGGKRGRRV